MKKLSVPLYEIAHARTGDKGSRANISVIAYQATDFAILQRELTTEKVKAHFGFRKPTVVKRYDLPHLMALNFVIDDLLDGGVNLSLNLDSHGKSLSYWLLAMKIEID